jgi:LPXTG-site transpeptidase (sortase) family protein
VRIGLGFKKKKILLPIVLAILVLLAIASYHFSRPETPAATVKAAVVTYSTDTPDETKPDKSYEWKGAPNDPKHITLPTIETEGFIQNVGVDQYKQVAVPNNTHLAGWFTNSVKPGEKGLSIIDGHLNGRRSNEGIFANLQKLKKDNIFTIEFGNNSVKKFKVIDINTVTIGDAANALFSQDPSIKNQLNLITCGGNFDKQSQQYDKRIIVISELVSS